MFVWRKPSHSRHLFWNCFNHSADAHRMSDDVWLKPENSMLMYYRSSVHVFVVHWRWIHQIICLFFGQVFRFRSTKICATLWEIINNLKMYCYLSPYAICLLSTKFRWIVFENAHWWAGVELSELPDSILSSCDFRRLVHCCEINWFKASIESRSDSWLVSLLLIFCSRRLFKIFVNWFSNERFSKKCESVDSKYP